MRFIRFSDLGDMEDEIFKKRRENDVSVVYLNKFGNIYRTCE